MFLSKYNFTIMIIKFKYYQLNNIPCGNKCINRRGMVCTKWKVQEVLDVYQTLDTKTELSESGLSHQRMYLAIG